MKSQHFVWVNLRVRNLPEGRENNFLIKSPNPKMPGSNSCRKEKENRNKKDWQENEYPGWRIKQFQKIPSWGNFSWILREPIMRKIGRSRRTDGYCSSSVVTGVVSWSNNIYFIPLNLIIIWLNYQIQSSVPQTFPIQPVHPPRSSS